MTVREIRDLLFKYRVVVYTGSRNDDLEWMQDERRDLYEMGLIEREQLLTAISTLKREKDSSNG